MSHFLTLLFPPQGYTHPAMPEVGTDDEDTSVRRKKKTPKKKAKTKSVAQNFEDDGGPSKV